MSSCRALSLVSWPIIANGATGHGRYRVYSEQIDAHSPLRHETTTLFNVADLDYVRLKNEDLLVPNPLRPPPLRLPPSAPRHCLRPGPARPTMLPPSPHCRGIQGRSSCRHGRAAPRSGAVTRLWPWLSACLAQAFHSIVASLRDFVESLLEFDRLFWGGDAGWVHAQFQ